METNRRDVLAAGAAVAAVAAAPKAAAQQTGLPGTTKFYQRGNVKIAYQEVGTGFPLLLCKYAQVSFQVGKTLIVCFFKLSKCLALVQHQVLYFFVVHMLKSLYDVNVLLIKRV